LKVTQPAKDPQESGTSRDFVKYMQVVDAWFDGIIQGGEGEHDSQYRKRAFLMPLRRDWLRVTKSDSDRWQLNKRRPFASPHGLTVRYLLSRSNPIRSIIY
jgi:hypothetical protein